MKVILGFDLDFDLDSGQRATASSTKNRTLRDILSYFYGQSTTTDAQKAAINAFLQRNNLTVFP